MNLPKVYIVVLNYNSVLDTLECLESLFNIHYMNFTVIVCDNGSKDNSIELIQKWAQGSFSYKSSSLGISVFRDKIVTKPIPYLFLDVDQTVKDDFHCHQNPQLIILDNKVNLGFGAGNNTGIRWALKDPEMEYIWILNNDTVVDPDSLSKLVDKMVSESRLGACGSTILYYHDRTTIQALGGFSYTPWTGKARQLGQFKKWTCYSGRNLLEKEIEKNMYWIQGASIFVKKEFIERVGLISEKYFLYFEEQDWGIRSHKMFRAGYASGSIVYHKEGRTTGAYSFSKKGKSLISEFYLSRSRLLFTKKYYPRFLLLIYISHLSLAIFRLLHRQWKNALVILLCSFFYGKEQKIEMGEERPYCHFIQQILAANSLWWMRTKIEKDFKES